MREQIKMQLQKLLTKAVDCPTKDDVIEELCDNLCEKYSDMTERGMEHEQAMEILLDSVGDIDEIITYINASAPQQPFDFEAAFEGFEKGMKELVKTITPAVKGVANDIATAATKATKAAKGPIKDFANDIAGALKGMEISASEDGCRHDYGIEAAELDGLNIRTENGDVTFGVSHDDNIYVVELSQKPLPEENRVALEVRGKVLHVTQGNKNAGSALFFNRGKVSSDYEIYLPRRAFNTISVTTAVGDVELENGMDIGQLEVKTAKGDITIPAMSFGLCLLNTVSGDIEISSCTGEVIKAQTVSGDIEINGRMSGRIILQSVSGDIEYSGDVPEISAQTTSGDMVLLLDSAPKSSSLRTTSGDVQMCIPDNEGFTLTYSMVSGDLRSAFNLMTNGNSKHGSAIYRDGSLRGYEFKSVSGDVRIKKR